MMLFYTAISKGLRFARKIGVRIDIMRMSTTMDMDYVQLGNSDLMVSKVCLGTMTLGEQNTMAEGVEQLHMVCL